MEAFLKDNMKENEQERWPQFNEAMNKINSRQKDTPFNASPGGVSVLVKFIICPAIKRMTGSRARVSKINGVNPG